MPFKADLEYRFDKCYDCVYMRKVPGNAHIKCVFNWVDAMIDGKVRGIPFVIAYGIEKGWYEFPLLFDPTWMALPCQGYSNDIVYYQKEEMKYQILTLMECKKLQFNSRPPKELWEKYIKSWEEQKDE
ncbi:MAG: hypothetical protein ACTSWQ_06665 [Candidatus Thorarchaeota archaeon]